MAEGVQATQQSQMGVTRGVSEDPITPPPILWSVYYTRVSLTHSQGQTTIIPTLQENK